MAMTIIDQFDLKAAKFNFSRDYFESVELLNKAPKTDFPNHFITNVAGTLYQLIKTEKTPDGKIDETKGTWKKLEFGDKNALTTDSSDKLQKNGSDVTNLVLGDNNNSIKINSQTGVTINSSSGKGTNITLGEGGLKISGADASDTKVWTTSGKFVDISGLPSEGAVAAIQAKLAGIDDTVKGYVDSQVGGLTQALVFKGGVPEGGLPANPKVGDTYVVSTAGDYAGETCEVGDTIICTAAKVGETAAKWLVVQKNLDGAVTKGDEQDWSGKLIVGAGGNMISGLIGTEGQIIQADASGNPTYVDPNYATSDVVDELSGKVAANSTAIATVNKNVEDAVKLARQANDAAGTAQEAAQAAQTTANEAKKGLESKASKDVATEDAAGLMSAADKQKLDGLSNYVLPEVGTAVAKGFYKIATDSYGRVIETDAVTSTDIYQLIPQMEAIGDDAIINLFTNSTLAE